MISDDYLVRLVKPVLIHGRVLDPEGHPVAGAEVAFGNNSTPGQPVQDRDPRRSSNITTAN